MNGRPALTTPSLPKPTEKTSMKQDTMTTSSDATWNPYSDDSLTKLKTEVAWVTPRRAAALRATCNFDRQRSVRPDHVRRLADEMKHGWFLAGTPIWICVLPDHSMLLINGNHTLEAVVESGVSLPLTIVYQKVNSVDEAAQSYACFDIQRTRTWQQAAHAAGIDEGLPEPAKVLAAIGVIQANFSAVQGLLGVLSRTARFNLLEEYRNAALLIHGAIAGVGAPDRNQKMIRRAAVFAVALVTARYQPSAAEEFWGGVARDDGLRRNDPRKVLLRYMENNAVYGSHTRRDHSLAAGIAWNAFYTRRTIDYVKPNQLITFELLGTPWTRKGEAGPILAPAKRTPRVETGAQINGNGASQVVSVYPE